MPEGIFIIDWDDAAAPNAPVINPGSNPDDNVYRHREGEEGNVDAGFDVTPDLYCLLESLII